METSVLKLCDICQQIVEKELWQHHRQAEEMVLKKIIENYPYWMNPDGTPSEKCKIHYREFILKKRA
ncbi:MAG: hypothetical protein AABZ60_00345 [Planctomycetota bacterium]